MCFVLGLNLGVRASSNAPEFSSNALQYTFGTYSCGIGEANGKTSERPELTIEFGRITSQLDQIHLATKSRTSDTKDIYAQYM